MPTDHRTVLRKIKRFDQLIAYLRDEMGWPIARDSFQDVDDLFYDFTAEELGIDPKTAAKIESIKRLRPLSPNQPWGIFFVKFEPKKLPVVVLRRILSQVALKKRPSANSAERAAWAADDLLFVSKYGEGDERQISFAHFSKGRDHDLPTLKVLGWDNRDTALHLDAVVKGLTEHLAWPEDDSDVEAWRKRWRAAFTLRHGEVITTSKELSIRLAELARDIRKVINTALAIETETGPLTKLMNAFKEALVHDLDADGFADMYAQTIAYGLLSARIADPERKTTDDLAAHMRTNPFLRELMETFLKVGGRHGKAGGPGIDFDELGVGEVARLLDDANMEEVVRDFDDRNPQEDPVVHFYELFLKEYDPEKRMQRGVFYTPRPVVSYIVRSVDELLRREFGLQDGLADTTTWGEIAKRQTHLNIPEGIQLTEPFVQILDPATGTGTFLSEIIDLIHKTLIAKWKTKGHDDKQIEDLWNEYVPNHLLPRLHGYELMMAPYAISHLKIGLKLHETGYRFSSDERARVYLTNALEPAHDFSGHFEFIIPALAHEAHAVNEIKRKRRFTVIIGNPPYSGLSANMSEVAAALIEPYKFINGIHFGERKHWLHDDYVKFVRFCETSICATSVGIVGLITNHAFLDNPTFRGMRWNLLQSFDSIQLLDLHGNTMKREVNPTQGEDKNVFDIQQGVAISFFCRRTRPHSTVVMFGDLWGTRKHKYDILTNAEPISLYSSILNPRPEFYFFIPRADKNLTEYEKWPKLNKIFKVFSGGFITARDHFVIEFDKTDLLDRIEEFASPGMPVAAIRKKYFAGAGSPKYADGDTRGWKLPEAKQRVHKDPHWRERARRCLYRPFDWRWVYWADWMVDWPRPEVNNHLLHEGNIGLVFVRQVASGDVYSHFLVSRQPVDNRACYSNKGIMTLAPLYLYDAAAENGKLALRQTEGGKSSNFSPAFLRAFSAALGTHHHPEPEGIFNYAYAVFHSPSYRSQYEESLKTDFPRMPLPGTPKVFRSLGLLGSELIGLHLMESPSLEHLVTTYTGPKNPEVSRVGWSGDAVWLDCGPRKKGQTTTPGTIGFRGVPEAAWNFHIGGYQVCEKWLKDRKGRTLSKDDIAHYQKIVVAVLEAVRLMKEIDEVVEAHGGWPGAFDDRAWSRSCDQSEVLVERSI